MNVTRSEAEPTWIRNDVKSAIDLMLVNRRAGKFISNFFVDIVTKGVTYTQIIGRPKPTMGPLLYWR